MFETYSFSDKKDHKILCDIFCQVLNTLPSRGHTCVDSGNYMNTGIQTFYRHIVLC